MIPLMESQLGKNNGYPRFWQVFLILDLYNLGFIYDFKKVTDFFVTLNFQSKLSLKDLSPKLTILLALKSAARESEIGFPNIRYLINHSPGYTFHFVKYTKPSKRSKPRDPIKFHIQGKPKSVGLAMYY